GNSSRGSPLGRGARALRPFLHRRAMNAGRLAIALVVLSALSWLTHRYVWARLVRDAGWAEPWPRALTVAVFTLGALVPLAFVAVQALPRAVNAPLAWVVYTWLGFALYLFLLTAMADGARVVAAVAGTW